MKKPKKSIYDWMNVERNDELLYRLASGDSLEALITEYQILAANDGFNKRQVRALRTSVCIMSAYVIALCKDNKQLKSALDVMFAINQMRVTAGQCDQEEAARRMSKFVLREMIK